MTAGYAFPYRPTKYRMNAAPMLALSRHDDRRRPTVPRTYNRTRHEVDAVVATENPQRCQFGMSVLALRRDAVDLGLLDDGGIPLLNSHDSRHVLGTVIDVWIENRQLRATLRFDDTPAGRNAEAMVSRGELSGVSCWATVKRWTDEDGDNVSNAKLLNPHFSTWGDGAPKVFTAVHWVLNEISLTSCPSDPCAVIL